ncbi:hypothetical protein EYF80_048482 [Liparis tanakae]|uniref:Uncharacterized protein n=1 Tax=Liparis tanakae TaxID=230148 RepID=A0A4Z2FM47_9TELE|nr:hypothetical protein EYF80_048482 [Liparis tanakae]
MTYFSSAYLYAEDNVVNQPEAWNLAWQQHIPSTVPVWAGESWQSQGEEDTRRYRAMRKVNPRGALRRPRRPPAAA